jgi:hypothetical protein
MIEFRSVVEAVRCAIEVQTRMVERNAGPAPERMKFRTVHVAARRQAKTTYFGRPCVQRRFDGGSDDRREKGSEQWII